MTASFTNGGTATYQDGIVFAFNPTYIDFDVPVRFRYVDIICNGKTINVSLYQGKAHAYISKLLLLAFDDPKNERVREIYVTCRLDGSGYEQISFNITAIWGSISVGERMGAQGLYRYNEKEDVYERHVRWFSNLPQRLSIFNFDKFEYIDPSMRDVIYLSKDKEIHRVWDETFDYTFNNAKKMHEDEVIYLRRDEQKCGFFLRWIDNLGYVQYFLFAHRQHVVKTKDEYSRHEDMLYNGIYFGGGIRESKERTESVICAALNCSNEELRYVKTIVSSPFIDMYIGNDGNGDEQWVPVTVSAGDFSIDTQRTLKDFEITLNIPMSDAQQL